MDFSVLFARHFARLIWLIRTQPDTVDDQKGALRALVMVVKDGAVSLRAEEGRLTANGTPLPDILTGIKDVATALSGAVTYALNFEKGASPADVLGVARLIATDSPDPLVRRVAQLAPKSAKLVAVGEASEPARARDTVQLTTEMIAEIEADKARAAEVEAATDAGLAPQVPEPEPVVAGVTGDEMIDKLLGRLSISTDHKSVSVLLDELTGRIDVQSREGKVPLVLRAIAALVERERVVTDVDMRRAHLVGMRRVFRPQVLRLVMPALQRETERPLLRTILEYAGDDGVTVIFEELQRARTLAERAELIKVLHELPTANAAVVKLLADARWFVVRAAVELLGELGAPDSERAIAEVLKHSDERVRRSATASIARYDTPFAVDALYRALTDPSAPVRLQAVHGLAARKGNAKAAAVVVGAIDDEPEVEVQLAEIAALGRFATSDAVGKLARAAEPDGRLFRRKNPAYRVAAVQALADARTPAAMTALQALLNDREKDVRDAAARMIGR